MVRDQIKAAIEEVAVEAMMAVGQQLGEGVQAVVEHPANLEHGEYSSNIAMKLAKPLRRAPLQIANELKEKLQQHTSISTIVERIEIAPPGFLNFYLNWESWANAESKSSNENSRQRKKVLIEHTSINPNKSAHIGHLRNSCIGDTLARLLSNEGNEVEVHNYIDDLGNQLADTVVGLLHTSTSQQVERFGDFCWETYSQINQAYKEQPALLLERMKVLEKLEEGSSNIAWLGLLTAERIVREHVEEMKQFNIAYDVLVWESSIVREGFWARTFELLQKTAVFRQEEDGKLKGCWVLKQPGSDTGTEDSSEQEFNADKVLVRSNGILTYTAKDIAYHLWKFGLLDKDFRYKRFSERLWTTTHAGGVKKKIGHADMVINVIDQRQEYPQAMVKQALSALGFVEQASQLRHVSYGVVSLSPATAKGLGIDISEGKHAYAMSGRQGIGIKVADLLNRMEQVIDAKRSRKAGLSSRAIAAASIRYYLLRFHLQTEVIFDLEQATEVSGNTGVYLMYSYARACSILEKVNESDRIEAGPTSFKDKSQSERSLLRQLAYWAETRQAAVKELAPNLLCTYVHELSALFNHFYATCAILKADDPTKCFRLWLTSRYKQTMQEALHILGLPAPRRM